MSLIQSQAMTDINATALKHHAIIPDLLAAHEATSCGTTATVFGIGNGIALKVLHFGAHRLNYQGDTTKTMLDVVHSIEQFILA
ncbi:hypothetical protein Hamer_G020705 [Homarus americanus]|uniref:Uncharacterized protein n=1 Tax=Homarus americanus TaxID=6706 RepID=A0A8J5JRF0_HOMAM|nr:hypothetical protein Hamer_G020705 [Homarus americanus]